MAEEHLRIGDAEREQAAAALGEHYAAGRLTAEEHSERLDRIWSARTRGELGPVFDDLPVPHGPRPAATGSSAPPPSWAGRPPARRGVPGPLVAVLVVLLVLTVLTRLPLILIGVVALFFMLGRHRGRLHGSRSRWR
jgi:uncharacterized membrane protein